MILYIDTTDNDIVKIALEARGNILASKEFSARRQQSEKLLPEIDKILKAKKKKISDIKSIRVADQGGSFTSLRIGVVTANALGYALGIPVTGSLKTNKTKDIYIVKPVYDREPNITKKKAIQ